MLFGSGEVADEIPSSFVVRDDLATLLIEDKISERAICCHGDSPEAIFAPPRVPGYFFRNHAVLGDLGIDEF